MGWLGQYCDLAADWMNGKFWFDSLQRQQRLFSFSHHLHWLWNWSNHFFVDTRGSSSRYKVVGKWYWPLTPILCWDYECMELQFHSPCINSWRHKSFLEWCAVFIGKQLL